MGPIKKNAGNTSLEWTLWTKSSSQRIIHNNGASLLLHKQKSTTGTVSRALPFMTKVTILTSISQTFYTWVAIFHLRQPIVCLSHNSYGMPGLAPLMNNLFWERRDFNVSFSHNDMPGNVWNRPSGNSMVGMGMSSNIMKSPSPKCYMTFLDMIIYSDTFHWSDISPNHALITELDLITVFDVITLFREVSMGHLQRVRLANRGHLLLQTPGPVPFGTWICSNVETILSWKCHVFGPFGFRTSLGTSIFLIVPWKWRWDHGARGSQYRLLGQFYQPASLPTRIYKDWTLDVNSHYMEVMQSTPTRTRKNSKLISPRGGALPVLQGKGNKRNKNVECKRTDGLPPWHKQYSIGRLLYIGLGFFSSFLLYYTTQTERFAAKLCNFIICNNIRMSLLIRSIVSSLHT